MNEIRFWFKFLGLCAVLGGLVFSFTMKTAIRGGNVDVPALEGLPRANASLQLRKLGLKMDVIEERFSNQAAFGSVLEQDIEAGMTIKRGRAIKVVLSKGTRVVQVPELVGMRNPRQARLLMEQNGLAAGVIAYLHHSAPEGSIIAQSPEAGLQVARGSRVSLLVSKDTEKLAWVMPDLTERDLGEARERLKAMGVVLRKVDLVDPVEAEPGSVTYQSLSAGARVEMGSTLDLQVARGDSMARARYALIEYQVPDVGVAERRVQITVADARGRRVVYNSMEKPGAGIRVETKAWGSATYRVAISGSDVLEEEIP